MLFFCGDCKTVFFEPEVVELGGYKFTCKCPECGNEYFEEVSEDFEAWLEKVANE